VTCSRFGYIGVLITFLNDSFAIILDLVKT